MKVYVVDDGVSSTPLVIGTDYLLQSHVRTIVANGKVSLEQVLPSRVEVHYVNRKWETYNVN